MLIYSNRLLDRYGILATSLAILCDNSPTWRPTTCELIAPLTRHTFEFGTVKLLDFHPHEAALSQSDNPFAWITLAHLKTQATKRNPQSRKTWKFTLMRQLYERGMSSKDIRNLYEFIDWTMMLPEDLDMAFWQELKTFEEEQKVTYITSAERFGKQIGRAQGLEEGQAKKATEVALKLLEKGMDLATIAEVTELSIEQIQQLQAK
jgi:predicted transposase/invertase (TIGR01784 family)